MGYIQIAQQKKVIVLIEKNDVNALIRLASKKGMKEILKNKLPFRTFSRQDFVKELQSFVHVSEEQSWGITEINNLDFRNELYETLAPSNLVVVKGHDTLFYAKSKKAKFGYKKQLVDDILKIFDINMFSYPKKSMPMIIFLSRNPSNYDKAHCIVISECNLRE